MGFWRLHANTFPMMENLLSEVTKEVTMPQESPICLNSSLILAKLKVVTYFMFTYLLALLQIMVMDLSGHLHKITLRKIFTIVGSILRAENLDLKIMVGLIAI